MLLLYLLRKSKRGFVSCEVCSKKIKGDDIVVDVNLVGKILCFEVVCLSAIANVNCKIITLTKLSHKENVKREKIQSLMGIVEDKSPLGEISFGTPLPIDVRQRSQHEGDSPQARKRLKF